MEIEIKKGKFWYYAELLDHCQLYTESELSETSLQFEKAREYYSEMSEILKDYQVRVGDSEGVAFAEIDLNVKNLKKAILHFEPQYGKDNYLKTLKILRDSFQNDIKDLKSKVENPYMRHSKSLNKHRINALKQIIISHIEFIADFGNIENKNLLFSDKQGKVKNELITETMTLEQLKETVRTLISKAKQEAALKELATWAHRNNDDTLKDTVAQVTSLSVAHKSIFLIVMCKKFTIIYLS